MTRDELFRLVWQFPIVRLAKDLGMSNARLKKLCDDFEIPVPPAGYWAKVAAGKAVEKPSLSDPTPSILGKLNSALRRIGEIPLKIADIQLDEYDLKVPAADAPLPAPPAALHPCAARLASAIATSPVDDDGFVTVRDSTLPAVRISPRLMARTASLLSSLIGTMQSRGHKIIDRDGPFRIAAGDETFELKVYETRQRVLDQPSHPQAPRRFRASGKLCLEIVDPGPFRWGNRNLVGQWHDRSGTPVEAVLDEVAQALTTVAAQISYFRAKAQEQEGAAADQREQARRAAVALDRERREDEFLARKATAYSKLLELREFSEFLVATRPSPADASFDRMLQRISSRLADLQKELTPGQLADEARQLDLFGDDA